MRKETSPLGGRKCESQGKGEAGGCVYAGEKNLWPVFPNCHTNVKKDFHIRADCQQVSQDGIENREQGSF